MKDSMVIEHLYVKITFTCNYADSTFILLLEAYGH